MTPLGEKLRELRRRKGVSQKEMAARNRRQRRVSVGARAWAPRRADMGAAAEDHRLLQCHLGRCRGGAAAGGGVASARRDRHVGPVAGRDRTRESARRTDRRARRRTLDGISEHWSTAAAACARRGTTTRCIVRGSLRLHLRMRTERCLFWLTFRLDRQSELFEKVTQPDKIFAAQAFEQARLDCHVLAEGSFGDAFALLGELNRQAARVRRSGGRQMSPARCSRVSRSVRPRRTKSSARRRVRWGEADRDGPERSSVASVSNSPAIQPVPGKHGLDLRPHRERDQPRAAEHGHAMCIDVRKLFGPLPAARPDTVAVLRRLAGSCLDIKIIPFILVSR